MRIGWLGLGAMGAPMASCLARAGHDVAGYDVVPGRAASLAAGRLRAADTIAAAARDADLVAVRWSPPPCCAGLNTGSPKPVIGLIP